jgi:hypothetical protein
MKRTIAVCAILVSMTAAAFAHAVETPGAAAELQKKKEQIALRSARVAEKDQSHATVQLARIAARVDKTRVPAVRVAESIAKEFGVHTYIVLDQNLTTGASWGKLVIAYTLASAARGDVTVEQLVQLQKGGMSWGVLAAGLGLDLRSVVHAADTEANVARGQIPADGKLATIRPDNERNHVGGQVGASKGGPNSSGPVGVRVGK